MCSHGAQMAILWRFYFACQLCQFHAATVAGSSLPFKAYKLLTVNSCNRGNRHRSGAVPSQYPSTSSLRSARTAQSSAELSP